ncbi:MAG TPA: hypothetical protein VNQ76_04925 [Planctomicrobium sp.]|nr:hypothetical protein [Planctomicrobium sp.]
MTTKTLTIVLSLMSAVYVVVNIVFIVLCVKGGIHPPWNTLGFFGVRLPLFAYALIITAFFSNPEKSIRKLLLIPAITVTIMGAASLYDLALALNAC